jgi:hypothetical protein
MAAKSSSPTAVWLHDADEERRRPVDVCLGRVGDVRFDVGGEPVAVETGLELADVQS